MRKIVEREFETRSGGEPLVQWMFQQKNAGASLRTIADRLTAMTGMRVSHESVRQWMLAG